MVKWNMVSLNYSQVECEVDLVHGFNDPFDVLVHCLNQWWECIHSLTFNAYVFGVIPSAIGVVENVVKSIVVAEMVKYSAMLHMWSCIVKLDEEKSNYANFTQENCFGST
jgi:hypothetical protein